MEENEGKVKGTSSSGLRRKGIGFGWVWDGVQTMEG